MNIKGILRRNGTVVKLIAFAGIVGCFAGALFLVENTITDFAANGLDQMVYRFGGRFCRLVLYASAARHNVLLKWRMRLRMAWTQRNSAGSIRILRETIFGRMGDKTVGDDTLTEAAAKILRFT